MSKKIEVLDKVKKIVYLTQPSPIVLISTISVDGIKNLAPYAMFMNCSTKPPMVAVGISPKTHTFANIVTTHEFVIGIPKRAILPQVFKAGNNYPPDSDEFAETGLTPYQANNVRPSRILECCVNLDCRLSWHREAGNHHVMVADVVGADIDDELFSHEAVLLRSAIPRLYHLTGAHFVDGSTLISVGE